MAILRKTFTFALSVIFTQKYFAEGTCPSGWRSFSDSCYLFPTQTKNWQNAKRYCESRSSYLAIITSAGENTFIRNIAKKATVGTWLGATDYAKEGTFVWENGAPLVYTDWQPGEPNNYDGRDQKCMAMGQYANYRWDDEFCNTNYRFVCELIQIEPSTQSTETTILYDSTSSTVTSTESTTTTTSVPLTTTSSVPLTTTTSPVPLTTTSSVPLTTVQQHSTTKTTTTPYETTPKTTLPSVLISTLRATTTTSTVFIPSSTVESTTTTSSSTTSSTTKLCSTSLLTTLLRTTIGIGLPTKIVSSTTKTKPRTLTVTSSTTVFPLIPQNTDVPITNTYDTSKAIDSNYENTTFLNPISSNYPHINNACYSDCLVRCYTNKISADDTIELFGYLKINRKSTSKYKRSLISVGDDRVSSVAIGYTGIIVIVLFCMIITFIDLSTLYSKCRKKS